MTTEMTRRAAWHVLGGAVLAGIACPERGSAQAYPSRSIRIVHGYNSGTNPDVISRIIGPAVTSRLGQPVVVEPKPGAAGRIATGYVATQPPDGYTMMMLTAGDGVTAAFYDDLPYNLLRDYAFVATTVHTSLMLVVSSDSPLRTTRDLLDAGKRTANGLTFGTPGVGTTQHLAGELLKLAAGINLVHVPYRENAFPDLLGGRLDLLIAAPSVSGPQIASGRVRAIAVTSRDRIDAAKDVPTLGETGVLAGFDVSSWLGLAVPVKTEQSVIDILSDTMRQVLADETVRSRLRATGSDVGGLVGGEFRARVESDIDKWKTLVGKVQLNR
jgi:tripartite-type tricarboxylate transporter receptor subunit TctC